MQLLPISLNFCFYLKIFSSRIQKVKWMRIRIHSPACNIQYAKRPSEKYSVIALRFCRTTFNGTVFFIYLFMANKWAIIFYFPLCLCGRVWKGGGGRPCCRCYWQAVLPPDRWPIYEDGSIMSVDQQQQPGTPHVITNNNNNNIWKFVNINNIFNSRSPCSQFKHGCLFLRNMVWSLVVGKLQIFLKCSNFHAEAPEFISPPYQIFFSVIGA